MRAAACFALAAQLAISMNAAHALTTSICDPVIKRIADRWGHPSAYKELPNPDRCEGRYGGTVSADSADSLKIVGFFIEQNSNPTLAPRDMLDIRWQAFFSSEARIQGYVEDPALMYRMDTVQKGSDFTWPMKALNQVSERPVSQSSILLSAWQTDTETKRTVYIPVWAARKGDVAPQSPSQCQECQYKLYWLASPLVKKVRWKITMAGGNSQKKSVEGSASPKKGVAQEILIPVSCRSPECTRSLATAIFTMEYEGGTSTTEKFNLVYP